MDDTGALEGGAAATIWQRQHAARQRRKLQKLHRVEAKQNKLNLLREARADLKKRKAKWLAGWKRKAAAAKAAGLPIPSKMGAPWRLGTENSQVVDMTGWTFGRLTVIRSAPISLTMRTAQRCRVWVVKCSCGSPERMVNGTTLRQGNSKSCGCLVREHLRAAFARKRAEKQKLAHAPLSIRIAELRHRIFKKERIFRRDTMLLDSVRQLLIDDEVRAGVRRYSKTGRAMLVRPAGIPAARGHGHRMTTMH
jgi:hypothetical protein